LTRLDSDQPAVTERSERSVILYLATLGIMLAFGIDVALPAFTDIRDGLGLDDASTATSLTITMYFLGMAVGQLFWGPVSDRFGRQPAMLAGIALYAVSALASALAPSFGFLLFARLIWGLGAAASAALRFAIARDLYTGDRMARVTTIMMAVFLVGPVIVPSLGALILTVASWRIVFLSALGMALISLIWTLQFGETLAEDNRRPLDFTGVRDGFRIVISNRVTAAYIVSITFTSASFFVFLASSQPMFEKIYDRESQFAVLFGAVGLFTIIPLVINDRLIQRYGAATMAFATCRFLFAGSSAGLVMILIAGSVPPFWVWWIWVAITSATSTVFSPVANALALEPMGQMAGTAAAVLGFVSLAAGSALGALVDVFIGTTVTPMVLGQLGYSALSLLALMDARRHAQIQRPDATESPALPPGVR